MRFSDLASKRYRLARLAGADSEYAAIGADRDVQEVLAVPMRFPDGRRAAQEGGEQVATGLRCVVDGDRLPREQERAAEVVLDERLRAEALGELGRPASRA